MMAAQSTISTFLPPEITMSRRFLSSNVRFLLPLLVGVTRRTHPFTEGNLPIINLAACRRLPEISMEVWPRGQNRSVDDFHQAIHTPLPHRAHHFLTMEDVLYICNFAWPRATYVQLKNSEIAGAPTFWESWAPVTDKKEGSWVLLSSEDFCLYNGDGFTILKNFTLLEVGERDARSHMSFLSSFPCESIAHLHSAIGETLPPLIRLSETPQIIWEPRGNMMKILQREDRDTHQRTSFSCRSSSKTQSKCGLQCKDRALMSGLAGLRHFWTLTWVICLNFPYQLQEEGICSKVMIASPKLDTKMFPSKRTYAHVFPFLNGPVDCKLYTCRGTQHFLFKSSTENSEMSGILRIDCVKLPPFSILIGHLYVQHAEAEYISYHNLGTTCTYS